MVVAGCVTPATKPTPPAPNIAERTRALMRDLADRNLFQGAVVIGRAGRIEYAVGFGFADRERQVIKMFLIIY